MHRCDMSRVLLEGHANCLMASAAGVLSSGVAFPRGAASPRRGCPPLSMSEKQPADPVGATVILGRPLAMPSCRRRLAMASWQLRLPWPRHEDREYSAVDS